MPLLEHHHTLSSTQAFQPQQHLPPPTLALINLSTLKTNNTANMQLSSILSIFTLATAASAVTVSYDTGYDNKSRSLTAVSCSDGSNGLMTKHPSWKTQGDIPKFPYIGGIDAIAGWNSPSCGTCWKLEYNGKSINVLAIDHAASGFNIGLAAMNALTHGQAGKLGRVNAKATKVSAKNCGL